MNYRKVEISIHFDGTTSRRDLGWVAPTNIDSDMAWERDRLSNIARSGGRISSIEVTRSGIVVTYADGINAIAKAIVYVEET